MSSKDATARYRKKNPDKVKEWDKRKYQKHKKKILQARKIYQAKTEVKSLIKLKDKARRDRNRQLVNWYKRIGCAKCEEDHIACLVMHHRNPKLKKFTIGACISIGCSIKRLKIELNKCVVLCANCHRKLHWRERNG